MNYYEHHLGDYVRDTAHLSMLEEGAYLRLLHQYYIREKPLPADSRECCRLARAVSKPEQKAVDYILGQFFDRREDGYHQGRTDREIERYIEKRTKAKTSSVLGVEARRAKSNGHANGQPNGVSNGQPTDQPNGLPLQSPVPNPQSPSKPSPTPPSQGGASRESRSERRNRQQEALQRWNRLVKSDGADRQGLSAAMAACGGWPAIRMRSEADDARLRKQFVDAYLAGDES